MRIRITQSFAEGWSSYQAGQELDVPEALGVGFLKMGVAERLPSAPETATLPDRGEKAVRGARPAR